MHIIQKLLNISINILLIKYAELLIFYIVTNPLENVINFEFW